METTSQLIDLGQNFDFSVRPPNTGRLGALLAANVNANLASDNLQIRQFEQLTELLLSHPLLKNFRITKPCMQVKRDLKWLTLALHLAPRNTVVVTFYLDSDLRTFMAYGIEENPITKPERNSNPLAAHALTDPDKDFHAMACCLFEALAPKVCRPPHNYDESKLSAALGLTPKALP